MEYRSSPSYYSCGRALIAMFAKDAQTYKSRSKAGSARGGPCRQLWLSLGVGAFIIMFLPAMTCL